MLTAFTPLPPRILDPWNGAQTLLQSFLESLRDHRLPKRKEFRNSRVWLLIVAAFPTIPQRSLVTKIDVMSPSSAICRYELQIRSRLSRFLLTVLIH